MLHTELFIDVFWCDFFLIFVDLFRSFYQYFVDIHYFGLKYNCRNILSTLFGQRLMKKKVDIISMEGAQSI